MHATGKVALLTGITVLVVLTTYTFVPSIPQWPEYHQLADRRSWLGIPNTLNVLSSIPLVIIGWLGFSATGRLVRVDGESVFRLVYRILFICILLTGLGSVVYHVAPNNMTLIWDRLPISVGFMALFASVIAEMINYRWVARLLPILSMLGMGSVFYWTWSEANGAGDLRWYGLVQFLPMLLILLILGLYRGPERYFRHLFGLVALYGVSKLLEWYDAAVFHALDGVISGHTLKHLAAAGGVIVIVRWVLRQATTAS